MWPLFKKKAVEPTTVELKVEHFISREPVLPKTWYISSHSDDHPFLNKTDLNAISVDAVKDGWVKYHRGAYPDEALVLRVENFQNYHKYSMYLNHS